MQIIIADGIDTSSEHSTVSLQAAQTLAPPLSVEAQWVQWPAAMAGVGGSGSWVENPALGLSALTEMVDGNHHDIVLIGYSGGNRIAHEFLDTRPDLHARVRAVGLISDPFRPRDKWLPGTANPQGWGVCGERYGPLPERTVWCAAAGDVITCAEPDSLLRTVADLSASVSDHRWSGVLSALRRNLDDGSFQLAKGATDDPVAWAKELRRRVATARADIDRYFGGWHTDHYTDPYQQGPSLVQRMCVQLAKLTLAPACSNTDTRLGDVTGQHATTG